MILVKPEKIASLMGLLPSPHSFAELDKIVSDGLPKSSLKTIVDLIGMDNGERRQLLYQIVPEATYKRRRDKLTAEESARTERLARIYATAQYVWDSDDDAKVFLHTPHPLLHNQTPLDVAMSELGARRVEELLWQLHYGLSA
ncbi:MAG: antitoxin Xre/MbcA/ParS toxin-binding domain-containing protein [Methylococcales bacterium]